MENLARAVIIKDGKILLCKLKDTNFYFLPGGHLDEGEPADVALTREIQEELSVPITDLVPIGTVENFYTDARGPIEEVNNIFTGNLTGEMNPQDTYTTFEWVPMEKVSSIDIRPKILKQILGEEPIMTGFKLVNYE